MSFAFVDLTELFLVVYFHTDAVLKDVLELFALVLLREV
jgi:hypothetical protein